MSVRMLRAAFVDVARVLPLFLVAFAAFSRDAFSQCTSPLPPECGYQVLPCNTAPAVTGVCPTATGCVPGCPPTTLTVAAEIGPCDSGVRLNQSCIAVPKFDPTIGTLKSVAVRVDTRPHIVAYRVENISAQGAVVPSGAANTPYNAFAYLDVADPITPGLFVSQTSDKVPGAPAFPVVGGVACLNWNVTGQLPPGAVIPAADGCIDFADPSVAGVGCPGVHGGPCELIDESGLSLPAACNSSTCPPSGLLGGTRTKCGRFTSTSPLVPGYTDKREYGPTFPDNQTYTCTKCYTIPADLTAFSGAGTINFPIDTLGGLAGINYQGGSIIQRSDVEMRCRITITYTYCPVPPTCQPFTTDVCRTNGSTALVNVLSSVTAPVPAGCVNGGIDCAALTGTANLTQPTFGTVAWVNDASLTNPWCNGRGIRYTLTTLPPATCTTDTFTYTVSVPGGCSTTCTVTVRIGSPTANADKLEACYTANTQYTIPVLANDEVCTSLGRTLVCPANGTADLTQPAFGSVAWVTDATVTNLPSGLCPQKAIRYTAPAVLPPNPSTTTFTYTIRDNLGCTSTGTVTINLSSPIANPDKLEACYTANTQYTIAVLANDSVNSTRRTLACPANGTADLTQPAFGTVAWVTDATVTNQPSGLCPQKAIRYTAPASLPANGSTTTFTYTIRDSAGCATTGTVTINLSSPIANADKLEACYTANTPYTIAVLANDSVNSTRRTLVCPTDGTAGLTQPAFGSVAWVTDATVTNSPSGLCPQKAIRYTAPASLPANPSTTTFTYTITDTAGCSTVGTVTVNLSTPVANPDKLEACYTASAQYTIPVLANDVLGSTRRTLACPANGTADLTQPAFGTVAWVTDATVTNLPSGLCPQKAIRYTAPATLPANGSTTTFTYTIRDSAGCATTGTVTINLSSPLANPDNLEACLTPNTNYVIQVLGNDSVNSTRRTLACPAVGVADLTQPAVGSVQWVNDAGATNLPSGLCPQRAIRYTTPAVPPANPTTTTFTYTIRDSAGCTATATVTVRLAAPRCQDDCIDLCATQGATKFVNVLANDLSVRPLNCAVLAGTANLTQGTYGSVMWADDGSCTNTLCNLRCVLYTLNTVPPIGVNTDSFSYTIVDDNGCTTTCTVQVRFCRVDAVDDPPVSTCAATPTKVCVLGNDTTTCGAITCNSLSIVTPPLHGTVQIVENCSTVPGACGATPTGCTGCCIVYTSEPGYVGTDSFTYRVSVTSSSCPGGSPITCTDVATASVSVKPSPVAVDDTYQLDTNQTLQPFDVRDNDSPGVGCDTAGCGAPCAFVGCPVIISQPAFGTVTIDPVTCEMTYTPTPGQIFPGTDSFCYRVVNNCGCCDEACVTITECPAINRRRPGSLLLYPEFDNRDGYTTILTVTNTSCDFPAHGVFVEFLYIDKNTCIETNVTNALTPCDTLTVFTRNHAPVNSRGYVYAFAKDANGVPISHNYLIGDLLVLEGTSSSAYAVNPVSFRSPLKYGLPTDLDDDGIRDLDGNEYDLAPDEILIPRFLGQDPPQVVAGVKSDLIVIALSGGVAFNTTIAFAGYNDNEVPFSITRTFFCWEKWPLTSISGAFDNQFLKSLGDAPLEILGNSARESGWFKVDGVVATSIAPETIVDPAIYALLVERIAPNDKAAELPWELCAQRNGDLLPKHPLGDGPVPVAGDNQ